LNPPGFLAPYRVVDLTDERGIVAGRILRDLGAEVVHVEPPGGSTARRIGPWSDEQRTLSLYWEAFTHGQQSVTCDVAQPDGRDLLLRLVDSSDFVIDSFNPVQRANLGLTADVFLARSPRIVHVSISPFGEFGPMADAAATDLTVWAAGGALHGHTDDGTPTRVGPPQAFVCAGADGAAGALIAHLHRVRTGMGQHVSVAAQVSCGQATVGRILSAMVGDYSALEWPLEPTRPLHELSDEASTEDLMRRSKWRLKDGFAELIVSTAVGRRTNNLWKWMADEGGAPSELEPLDWSTVLADIKSGRLDVEDLRPYYIAIGRFLATKTKTELCDAAARYGLLAFAITTVEDLANSVQLRDREFWAVVGEGACRQLTVPGPYARTASSAFSPPSQLAPTIGEHNHDVYQSLCDLTLEQLDELAARGIV
jgi:crotonobetainyl-CoA:carnitine CoA-transferase CaiB-like acyl-CoA transferase